MEIQLPTNEQLETGIYPEDVGYYEKLMEAMANAPREEMGKRQPGEKGSYERG